MQIMNEIVNRRSIRKYKDIFVKEEDVLQIIEAGRLAPSGSNTQPWKYIVIRNDYMRKKIAEVDHHQQWMTTAPVLIVCLADIRCRIKTPHLLRCDESSSMFEVKQIIRDSAISIGFMLLEAEHIGLATCWTGWYEQKDMKRILELPDYMYVNGIITLGYADETVSMRPRKALEEVVYFEKWSSKYENSSKRHMTIGSEYL